MGWTDNRQAWQAEQEYRRQNPNEKPDVPETEADALRAYKAQHTLLVPTARATRQRRELEALAEKNGWAALAEFKTKYQERRAAYERAENEERLARQQKADQQVSGITSRLEATQLHEQAVANGDHMLVKTIKRTATEKGWNLMAKNVNDAATELHEQFSGIIASRNAVADVYRDDLRNGRITPEYVAEKTASSIGEQKGRLEQILADATGYLNDAQAEYDNTYRALTTPTGDTNEQLLAEMRATKAWDRIQRELSTLEPGDIATTLANKVTTADPGTLRALIEEAPSFLAGHGVRDADALVRSMVDARPELADARVRIGESTRLRDVVTHNTGRLSKLIDDIAGDATNPDTLVGYVNPTAVTYNPAQRFAQQSEEVRGVVENA